MSRETNTLSKTTYQFIGKLGKYGTILIIIGSIMLAIGIAQIDFRIDYSELGSQTNLVHPFYVSKDNQRIQISVFSYSLDTQHIGIAHYYDQVLKVVIEYSTSNDFTQNKVIFSQISDKVNFGFYSQSGWYRIVVTNLSNDRIGVGFGHAQSTTGNSIFTAISGVLLALGISLLAVSFSLVLTFSILFVVFYPLFKLIELSFSKRERERDRIYYPMTYQNYKE